MFIIYEACGFYHLTAKLVQGEWKAKQKTKFFVFFSEPPPNFDWKSKSARRVKIQKNRRLFWFSEPPPNFDLLYTDIFFEWNNIVKLTKKYQNLFNSQVVFHCICDKIFTFENYLNKTTETTGKRWVTNVFRLLF